MMKLIIPLVLSVFTFVAVHGQKIAKNDLIIAKGKMPDITKDNNNQIYIVYGSGDSIMYLSSKDGKIFTTPSLIGALPKLIAIATRGPQIAVTKNGLVVTACDRNGNIFSYFKNFQGRWSKAARVNKVSGVAKEALNSLSADGQNVYTVWLNAKESKGQDIYGAVSTDGGKTWNKNILVYASPDGTVCECCKPSVMVKGRNVYVMYRNWLNGSRDLYLIKSKDGGSTFELAQKLGYGSWKLNGCPMDGGGLSIDNSGSPVTVWRRENKIYAAKPGFPEREIGEGRSCTIETIGDKIVYSWTEKGDVMVMTPSGNKINLGKGSSPLIKGLNGREMVCVWENGNEIHSYLFQLKDVLL